MAERETKVRLSWLKEMSDATKIIFTIIATVTSATWYVSKELQQIHHSFELNSQRISNLEKDTIKIPFASEAALRTAIANRGLKIPDPRDLTKFIYVEEKTDLQAQIMQQQGKK